MSRSKSFSRFRISTKIRHGARVQVWGQVQEQNQDQNQV